MLGLCHDDEVQIFLAWNSNKPLQTCTSQIFIWQLFWGVVGVLFSIPSSRSNEPLNRDPRADWQEVRYRYNLGEIPYLRKCILGVCLKASKRWGCEGERSRRDHHAVHRLLLLSLWSASPLLRYAVNAKWDDLIWLDKSKHSFACSWLGLFCQ